MPVISQIHTNFTGGILSPQAAGRVDADRYNSYAKDIVNGIPLATGGVIRRPGTRMVAEAHDNDARPKLISYVFNEDQAYMLEFGAYVMRVFHDGALVDFELETPYSAEQIKSLGWTRSGDTLYLLHRDLPPRRVQRFAHNLWRIEEVAFDPMPYAEIGHRLSATLTLSAATVGTGRTVDADAESFLESDVGRELISGQGRATITAYTDSTTVTVTISAGFASTTVTGATITGSPLGAIKPQTDAQDLTIGSQVTLESAEYNDQPEKVVSHLAGAAGTGTTTVTATVTGHGYSTSDEVNIWGFDIFGLPKPPVNGTFTITVSDANTFTYTITGEYDFDEPDNGSCRRVSGTSAAKQVFREEDVGSFVQINGGLVKITAYDSRTKVTGTMARVVSSDITAAPNAWILSQPAWNAVDGYPRAGTFYQQRLFLAGSSGFPHTVWGSATGYPHDFELWVNDDSAFSFTLSADEINPVLHLSAHKALVALTSGSEFIIQGGIDKPVAPTNVQAVEHTWHGSNAARPVKVGNELMFSQRGGTRMRAISYRFESDSFVAPDVSWIACHLFTDGTRSMAYQEEPYPILWRVSDDDVLTSLTIDRDSETVAWTRHETDGTVEDVAVIPGATEDQVWIATRRHVGYGYVRFIEVMDWDIRTDCAVVHDGAAATVWDCEHLGANSVDVVSSGAYYGRFPVTSGQVTLPVAAASPEIGLPFTTTVHLLTPQVDASGQTNQAGSMRTSEVVLRLHETVGASVNGTMIPFAALPATLGEAITPYTGDVRLETLGWERGSGELVIEQTQPLPFHLLAVMRRFGWNG